MLPYPALPPIPLRIPALPVSHSAPTQHEIQSSIEAVAEDALTKWRVRDIAGLEQLCAARFASLANELERDTDLYAP